MPHRQFDTSDGHNPEIIYHLLEEQDEYGPQATYHDLDNFLRRAGPSRLQMQVEAQEISSVTHWQSWRAPSPYPEPMPSPEAASVIVVAEEEEEMEEGEAVDVDVDHGNNTVDDDQLRDWSEFGSESFPDFEATEYAELMQRLVTRHCADLSGDTDAILERDYFHGVQHIYPAAEVIRHMTTVDGKFNFFSPVFDTVRKAWRQDIVCSMDPPYTVVLPDPAKPGLKVREPITLRHVSLPGWLGAAPTLTSQEMEAKVEEWELAILLAEGRLHQATLFTPAGQLPSMATSATMLGFPTVSTLYRFAYQPAVREAFRELWNAALSNLDSDREIPGSRFGRRPVALRIFYTRRSRDESEFNAARPDKTGWGLASHLARFCLKVETVCNADSLPPMRGQVPVLPGRAPSSTVAWGGIELARVLRRMAKGFSAFPNRRRYLDDDTPVERV